MTGLDNLGSKDSRLRRATLSKETVGPPETQGAEVDPLEPDRATRRYAHVVRRIAREEHVRTRTAERRFVEMLKFLDVCAQAEETVSPPTRVDGAWHCFILFTRDYAAYCQRRFGRFIHHEPMESRDTKAYKRAYGDATARFGELDRRIWPRPRDTGMAWFGACVAGSDNSGCGGGCRGGGCGGGA
jgi:hypothetical protein